jgi:hypothetical protein
MLVHAAGLPFVGCAAVVDERPAGDEAAAAPFRAFNDWRMQLYAPFISPVVLSLSFALTIYVFGAAALSLGGGGGSCCLGPGTTLGAVMWLLWTVPGLTIDYCTYKVSGRLMCYFGVATLAQNCAAGAFMVWWFKQ